MQKLWSNLFGLMFALVAMVTKMVAAWSADTCKLLFYQVINANSILALLIQCTYRFTFLNGINKLLEILLVLVSLKTR